MKKIFYILTFLLSVTSFSISYAEEGKEPFCNGRKVTLELYNQNLPHEHLFSRNGAGKYIISRYSFSTSEQSYCTDLDILWEKSNNSFSFWSPNATVDIIYNVEDKARDYKIRSFYFSYRRGKVYTNCETAFDFDVICTIRPTKNAQGHITYLLTIQKK